MDNAKYWVEMQMWKAECKRVSVAGKRWRFLAVVGWGIAAVLVVTR